MTLIRHETHNDITITSLKSESTCKLINRIPGLCLLYQVYQARLRERILNSSASLMMSTSILDTLPGKLDIKRCAPGILYLSSSSLFAKVKQFKSH